LRGYVVDTADRMQVPLDFIANPLVVALGSTIGRGLGIRPRAQDDWLVVPNFWGATVSPPGVLKTPSTEAALRPLRMLEDVDRKRHEQAQADANFSVLRAEAELEAVKRAVKSAAKDDGLKNEEDLRRRHREAEQALENAQPRWRRRSTSDATVEKLGELCSANPEGVLIHRDELSGWVANLGKEGREGDRQFYLESWSGNGRFISDRIKRGTTEVRGLCLSIYGTIQPDPLARIVRQAARGENDGLVSRFQLLAWPDISPDWRHVDRAPDASAQVDVEMTFRGVDELCAADFGAPPVLDGDVPAIPFDPDAQECFNAWFARLERRLRSGDIDSPLLAQHVAKYRSLVPSLALIFHVGDVARGVHDAGPVGLRSLERAIAWSVYLERHARRVYSAATQGHVGAAHRLLGLIQRGEITTGTPVRRVYRRGLEGLDRHNVESGLDLLEDHGWLSIEHVATGGRPTPTILIRSEATA
jgi:putative DNA primase/helicase